MGFVRVGLCFDTGILTQSRYRNSLKSLDVLLLPELFDGGYDALQRGARPHAIRDDFLQSFRTTSKRFPFCCIAGSTYLVDKSHHTNTSLSFRRGRLVHRYDKIHLFVPAGDRKFFQPGTSIRTFPISLRSTRLRAGVIICYDVRFPELPRAMALQGMQVLFVPARWPLARDDAWQTLLKARAIENQIFVVGCNALGSEGGYSYAFDPLGRMIFSNRNTPPAPLQTFTFNPRRLMLARTLHNNLREAVLLRMG